MNRILPGFIVLLSMLGSYNTVHASIADGETNAAVWYEAAVEKLHVPTPEVEKEILDVVLHGWNSEHPILEEYLQQNAQAITGFRQGARLPTCDFLKGQPLPQHAEAFEQALPSSASFSFLINAMFLEGRRHEKEGQEALALNNCLLVWRFGHHLGQQPHPVLLGNLLEVVYQERATEHMGRLPRLRFEGTNFSARATASCKELEHWKKELLKFNSNPLGFYVTVDDRFDDVVRYARNMVEGWA